MEEDEQVLELAKWKRRATDAEYRLEHPPLAHNQDDLARICYDAYMRYVSPDDIEPWVELDAWECYGWRLAAEAVRVAMGSERADQA